MARWTLSVAFLPICVAGFIGQAQAYEGCETNADCAQGLVCEIFEVTACSDVLCPEGEECPEPECSTESMGACVPAECSSDADCGEGLHCMAVSFDDCGDIAMPPPCEPDMECPEPEPVEEPDCEETFEYYCMPQYVSPCALDTDCGEGFECIEEELCACSGYDPGSGDDPPEEPECSCEPSGEMICSPVEVECENDDVCPEGWFCELGGDTPVSCGVDPETGEEHCEEPEPVTSGHCYPPYWDFDWYGDEDSPSGLELATGSENPRAQGPVANVGDDISESGCSMTSTSPSSASALALLIPLLIGLARRRR